MKSHKLLILNNKKYLTMQFRQPFSSLLLLDIDKDIGSI
jgi:hypothetical protein